MLRLGVRCKHSPHAEMVARRGLALGGSLGGWTHTALALLHDIHHVPSFQSHLRCGTLLVVGDGSVRLQDDGARDVCGAEVRDVPFPSPLVQIYSISGRPEATQDSPEHSPASPGPKPAGSQGMDSLSPGCDFLPAAALAQAGLVLALRSQPQRQLLIPLQGLLPLGFFLASFGRRKTSGFLILEGSEQRQLNVAAPRHLLPSAPHRCCQRLGTGCRISPKKVAGRGTHWLSVTGFMSSGRTLKKLTTCRQREILWGRLTSA